MTRRVVIAIVINVWLVLITVGCSTYFITRALLLADLDETIVSRVASLPEVERPASLPPSARDAKDWYKVYKEGKSVSSIASTPAGFGPPPMILTRAFIQLADGTRQRTLMVQAFAHRATADSPLVPVTVVYRASAEHVDALLQHLLYSLSFFAVLAALATAFAAYSVARAALRPMRDTADIIAAIDERSLNRRIDVARLPVELAPMGLRLNDLLARLELAFAQRRQFLADASHELRIPVAALVTTLEVALRRKRDSQDYVKSLDRCLTDARLLHQLVVGLLDQARSERFSDNPQLGPVLLSSLLQQCADVVAPLAERKGITLVRDLPEHVIVLSDEGLLRSAVVNLLSNAVEYTPGSAEGREGRIALSARVTENCSETLPDVIRKAVTDELGGAPRHVVIEVQDNGRGIEALHLPNIFEPFYRIDAVRSDSSQHLGLGLAVVRSNIRALGGDCRVENVPTGGCLFRITLPTVAMSSENSTTQRERVPVRQESS